MDVTGKAFLSRTLGFVAFGVAIGIVAIVPLAQLDRARGGVRRVQDAAMVVGGGLLIACAIAASGSAVVWLTFAFGMGTAALTGLTLHEVASGRSLHRLRVLRWLNDRTM